MVYKVIYNPGASPVPVSAQGHQLGGGDWGVGETTDPVVKKALETQQLVLAERPGAKTKSGVNPAASGAWALCDRYSARSDQVKALDKEALLAKAVGAGIIVEGDEILREDLEPLLVKSDVDLTPEQQNKAGDTPGDKG